MNGPVIDGPGQRARAELDQAERWLRDASRDRVPIAWALGAALALHAALLLGRLPGWGSDPVRVDAPRQVAMKVQFLEPPPAAAPLTPPVPEAKKVPRPDPTPDEPEPAVEPAPPEPAPGPDSLAPRAMGPMRVSPGQGPGVIRRVEPLYPPVMRAARREGVVQLDAIIHEDGTVGEITVVKSANPAFDRAAEAALRRWLFEPGDHDVVMTLTVNFVLR